MLYSNFHYAGAIFSCSSEQTMTPRNTLSPCEIVDPKNIGDEIGDFDIANVLPLLSFFDSDRSNNSHDVSRIVNPHQSTDFLALAKRLLLNPKDQLTTKKDVHGYFTVLLPRTITDNSPLAAKAN